MGRTARPGPRPISRAAPTGNRSCSALRSSPAGWATTRTTRRSARFSSRTMRRTRVMTATGCSSPARITRRCTANTATRSIARSAMARRWESRRCNNRMATARRLFGAAAAALIVCVSGAAFAAETAALYHAYWAGLSAGDIRLVLRDDPSGYRDEIAIRSAGLPRLITRFQGTATAEGRLAADRPTRAERDLILARRRFRLADVLDRAAMRFDAEEGKGPRHQHHANPEKDEGRQHSLRGRLGRYDVVAAGDQCQGQRPEDLADPVRGLPKPRGARPEPHPILLDGIGGEVREIPLDKERRCRDQHDHQRETADQHAVVDPGQNERDRGEQREDSAEMPAPGHRRDDRQEDFADDAASGDVDEIPGRLADRHVQHQRDDRRPPEIVPVSCRRGAAPDDDGLPE